MTKSDDSPIPELWQVLDYRGGNILPGMSRESALYHARRLAWEYGRTYRIARYVVDPESVTAVEPTEWDPKLSGVGPEAFK